MPTEPPASAAAAPPAEAPTQTPAPRMPPARLFKLVNPVLKAVLRSPLHRRLSKSLALLTFTGRTSGRR